MILHKEFSFVVRFNLLDKHVYEEAQPQRVVAQLERGNLSRDDVAQGRPADAEARCHESEHGDDGDLVLCCYDGGGAEAAHCDERDGLDGCADEQHRSSRCC